MVSLFLLLAAGSLTAAMFLTQVMRWLSPKIGLVAQPGAHRTHKAPTPTGGGVAIFVAVWGVVGAGVLACFWLRAHPHSALGLLGGSVHVPGVMAQLRELGVVFLGAAVIFLLGLADDRWRLSPWLRLAVHIGVGLLLVFNGMTVSIFVENTFLRGLLTVLWVAGLINSFNMLDNMDGLSAGVGLIICAMFAIVAAQTGQHFIAAFLCCLAGALGGFLLYNFPPAGIFMGDSGATQIGYLLAVMTVQFTFFQPERPYFPIAVPLLMFALPLFDTFTVVWIRLREGRSPFRGDTNHFSHRLVALGMTRRQAVLLIYLVTATVALGTTVLFYAHSVAVPVILAQAVAVFTIIGILENVRNGK